MKKLFLSVCMSLCVTAAAHAAQKLPATPLSALFYPNEILLTVEERIAPTLVPGKGKGLRVVLPQGSVQHFSVMVNGSPAASFYRLEAAGESALSSAQENNAERKALLLACENLETKIDQAQAAIKSVEARMALWQQRQPRKEGLTLEEMIKLDAALAEQLPQLFTSHDASKRALALLRHDLQKARADLGTFDARHRENVILVPFDGPENAPALLRYSYVIPGSCQTAYNLVAYPAREKLKIEQEALLFQNTDQTWKNVDVFVSTTRRDTAVRPAAISPWVIRLQDNTVPQEIHRRDSAERSIQMSQMPAAALAEESMESAPLPQEPVATEMGTFRLWSLGKRTIESGAVMALPLSGEEYAANFFYTLQPAHNPKGFLTAELTLDKALELPQGKARLFVDDVAVGEQTLSINGASALLYFGSDPQITATMRDLKRTKGQQGFISKEQNRLWHWEITVRNGRGRPVAVWVQDPIPTVSDDAVKLNVESKPKPEEATTARQLGSTPVYRWKISLQPGASTTIEHKVQLTAPAGRQLYTGGR